MDLAELALFLVEAKKNTYAAQKGLAASSRKGSKDLAYRRGRFDYRDSYFGERDFSGQEIVYRDEKPFWSLNYYGRMLTEEVPEGFIEALREALARVEKEEPYRGCRNHTKNDFAYSCIPVGDISFFHGHEAITCKGQEIYRLYFHGGQIL
jgi:hypothetical protein